MVGGLGPTFFRGLAAMLSQLVQILGNTRDSPPNDRSQQADHLAVVVCRDYAELSLGEVILGLQPGGRTVGMAAPAQYAPHVLPTGEGIRTAQACSPYSVWDLAGLRNFGTGTIHELVRCLLLTTLLGGITPSRNPPS